MGSTGVATGGVTPKMSTSVGSLADNADGATIKKYYKDNYGITIGGSYFRDNLDTKVLARASEPLDRLVSELGKDVFDEMGIKITSFSGIKNGAYAQTNIATRAIGVNPQLFDSYDTLKAGMHRDVRQGFHPKGMKAGDIIVHEVGHNLEFLINARANKGNRMNMLLADCDQTYARAIVQQAYKELKQEQPKLYSTEKQARLAISRYADSKFTYTDAFGQSHTSIAYTECLAEAVADYARNGQNAKPLSIKIWQGIKTMLL